MVVTAGPGGGGQKLGTDARCWHQDVRERQAVADQEFQGFSLKVIYFFNLSRAMGLWTVMQSSVSPAGSIRVMNPQPSILSEKYSIVSGQSNTT